MGNDVETDTTREARLLRCVSLGGIASLGSIALCMAGLAITGSMLAVQGRKSCPASQDAADAAARSFSLVLGWHDALGVLLILSLFFLIAMSVLFSLNIGFFEAKRTKRPWALTVMVGVLATCLIASLVLGKVYSYKMAAANHWLLAPQGGYSSDTVVTKVPIVSAGVFSTFVAFHAMLLPMLSIMVMALMWPPFCEFTRRPEGRKQGTKLKLSRNLKP